jgi:hypothetical protein
MKSILRTAAAGVALATFGIATGASAQTTATASADAEILAALSINVNPALNSLDFGTVAIGNIGAPAALVVPPTAAPALAGCSAQVFCGGTATAPQFTIDGQPAEVVDITIPATVTLTSGGNSMTVGSFTTSLGGTQATLDGAGDASFYLGGTLTIAPTQAAGVYTGNIVVSVAYN